MGSGFVFPRWQWRSFLTGGGSAFWLLVYGLYYLISKVHLDSFASVALYLGYLFIVATLNFVVTGVFSPLRFAPPPSSRLTSNVIPPPSPTCLYRFYRFLGVLLGCTTAVFLGPRRLKCPGNNCLPPSLLFEQASDSGSFPPQKLSVYNNIIHNTPVSRTRFCW